MKKFFKRITAIVLAGAMVITSAVSAGAEEVSGTNENLKSTTIYFDDLKLTLDEETTGACNYEVMPRGDTSYTSIPSQYWGAYNSSDGKYYLQINGGTSIAFRGKNIEGKEIYCHYEHVDSIYFYPPATNSDNFIVGYSQYTVIGDPSEIKNAHIYIGGRYDIDNKIFVINHITFYYQ